ncbi:hypothetical protein DQ04_00141140 [Trypanosoma grayi]|uniref:hypothetical protein n=1 Tax=Trypanosoma grayi TaxID=71804 RepID=UPI0004F48C79|nr:hypothetical protein DQ04_00141140 [Trypanosoma grayi]KEG15226.1 hypothetical protein DQ04_00141140 [Trypanosoma grayi]
MSKTLCDVFPDPDDAVCSSFLRTTDVSDKTWRDVGLIADSDDQTFWTVVANHRNLSLALSNLIAAIDAAHASAFRRQIKRDDELSLIVLLVRLVTTTSVVLSVGVSITDVARRLGELITPPLLMPTSLIILRHSGPIASATITSLILQNPGYLCAMPSTASSWCDVTSRLAVRCVREMSRGRHQRLAGDVIPLFEQVYRHVKQLWAIMHCSPFLADYVHLSRMLQYLRVVVDLLSPILQHFILTCGGITNRREQLSKANSAIVNAALNTASVLVLFRTYNKASGQVRSHCVERVVRSTYEALTTYITQKVQGSPSLLLSNTRRTLTMIIHELVPPRKEVDDLEVGKVLQRLSSPVPDSTDFIDGFAGVRPRYFELLLLELVHQGLHIDMLLKNKFITALEAEELGASERSITLAIVGIIEGSVGNTATEAVCTPSNTDNAVSSALETPPVTDDPLVKVVLEVMPHFNVQGILAALRYYNNDVEHFILDASMDNIVPHILEQLTEPSPHTLSGLPSAHQTDAQPSEAGGAANTIITPTAATAAAQHTLTSADYNDELGEGDLNLFIGCDLYEAINGDSNGAKDENNDDHISGNDMLDAMAYATHHPDDHRGGAEMFEVDEAMREKIRMLTEMMYEDEYDDAQEAGEVRGYETRRGATDSDMSLSGDDDNTITDGANDNALMDAPLAAAGTPSRHHRTEYDEKKFHEARSKQREKNVNAAKEARTKTPAYTKKNKTVRKKMQDKMAFTRAVKKGKVEF